tara:strand:+ start:2464 stop:2937 length:474 start_codon:yes stop_codon:yes gene_type:complete
VQLQQQLRALLDQEVENLQSLLEILTREYDSLARSDVAALEQGTALKNQALSIQAGLASKRHHLLSTHLGGHSDKQLADYVAGSGDAALQAAFARLSELAEQCHDNNRSNGRLIAQKQAQTRGALDILRHTDSTGATYSHAGKTSADAKTGRSLGKA